MAIKMKWDWKYFDSLENAREAVRKFEGDMQTELVKTYDHVYDPPKCKIQIGDEISDPFIILRHSVLKCKGSKDYIKKEVKEDEFENGEENTFSLFRGWRRTNCYLQIIIREIMRFPGYKEFSDLSGKNTFHSVKRIDRKKIRIAIENNDELLIRELGWWIKFPLNPIPCCHTSENNVSLQNTYVNVREYSNFDFGKILIKALIPIQFIYFELELETDHFETKMDFSGENEVYEIFPTKELANAAIEKFEISTMSQFIIINKRAYDTSKGRVRWDESSLTPYLIAESTQMECRHAKNRNLESNMKRRSLSKKGYAKNREERCLTTKKMNCKAALNVYSVYTFPQFTLLKNTKNYKMLKSRELKASLLNGVEILKIFECRVKFPSNSQHSHSLGDKAGHLQATDRRLHVKLLELTNKGIFNISELQKGLNDYVENELFKGQTPPSKSNRRFYPHIRYFRLGVYKAKKKLEKEGIDLFSRHSNSKNVIASANIQAVDSIQEVESTPTTQAVTLPKNAPFSLEELLGEEVVETSEKNHKYHKQAQSESTSSTGPNNFYVQHSSVTPVIKCPSGQDVIVQSWQSNQTEVQMQRSIHHITDLLQSIQDHTVEINSTQTLYQTETDLVTVLNNLRQSSDQEAIHNPK